MGKKYAIKVYQKSKLNDPDKKLNLDREISVLKELNHQNILRFQEIIET